MLPGVNVPGRCVYCNRENLIKQVLSSALLLPLCGLWGRKSTDCVDVWILGQCGLTPPYGSDDAPSYFLVKPEKLL